MLIEQIDGLDPEPFQRALNGLFDVRRPAVQACWMRIFRGADLEPELGCDHHAFAHGSEGVALEFFIRERTVNFRCIEQRHVAFDRSPNERNHLLPVLATAP